MAKKKDDNKTLLLLGLLGLGGLILGAMSKDKGEEVDAPKAIPATPTHATTAPRATRKKVLAIPQNSPVALAVPGEVRKSLPRKSFAVNPPPRTLQKKGAIPSQLNPKTALQLLKIDKPIPVRKGGYRRTFNLRQ